MLGEEYKTSSDLLGQLLEAPGSQVVRGLSGERSCSEVNPSLSSGNVSNSF